MSHYYGPSLSDQGYSPDDIEERNRYREALVDLMHRAVEARQVALKGDSLRVSNELYLMAEIVRAALQGAMSQD